MSKIDALYAHVSRQIRYVAIEYSMSGNVLVATQIVSFAESRIPPEKYPDFRAFVNAYIRATRQRLRVVHATP